MGVTIKDIAAAANVSIGTVDRVLHNRPYVKSEVRKKVLGEIERLNFVPNKNASLLKTGAKKTIGLMCSEKPHFFWDDLVSGAEAAAEMLKLEGVILKVSRTGQLTDDDKYHGQLRELCETGIDFLIISRIFQNKSADKTAGIIKRYGVPIALINVDFAEMTQKRFFVGPDEERYGRIAAGLVMKAACLRHVVVFAASYTMEINAFEKRINSFCRSLQNYSSNPPAVEIVDFLLGDGGTNSERVSKYISNKPADAVYLSNGGIIDLPDVRFINNEGKKPFVVAHELSPEIRSMLMNGSVDFSVCQNPYFQGNEAVKYAYKYLSGETIPDGKFISDDLRIATREML